MMETGLTGCLDRSHGFFGSVPPSQERQDIRGEGLDAQVEPVDPQFSKGPQKREIQVPRIRLQGEFRRRGQWEIFPGFSNNLFDLTGTKDGGSTSSDIDGIKGG
jgi:hypothetical protein